ncbi:MAG: hypothetical protein AO396_08210 [Candidatus Fermentibacter daniensis]|nr:MAG: hypothetical protein AO394_05990 [Candidatus Fermentibacter daniensis]KZD19466.1 MAG: hypothetical protein AO395_00190 [Candidatus Fermentibacter daniensis]KZD19768.1 MAG: hypothetical protein AO396_08210 [Candidatus Fermentibacter daniensis]
MLPPVVATSSIRRTREPSPTVVKPVLRVMRPSPSLWRKANGFPRCLAVLKPKTMAPKAGEQTTSISSESPRKASAIMPPSSSTSAGFCAILIFSK